MVLEQTRPEEKVSFKADEFKPRDAAGVGMGATKKIKVGDSKNNSGIFLTIIALLAITALFLFIGKNDLAAKNQQLKSDLDAAITAKASIEQQLNETTAIKNELQTRVDQMKQEAEALAGQIEQEKRSKEDAVAQLNQRTQENESLKTSLEAEKNEKLTLKANLENENKVLQAQLNEVKTAKESLEKKLKQTLARKGIKLEKIVVKPETGEMVPQGQVLVVNREFDFVVVNLGENDGLKVGSKLQVFDNNNQSLGVVEVEKIYGNMSAATITPDAKKDKISEGNIIKII